MESKQRRGGKEELNSSLLKGKNITIKVKGEGRPISAIIKKIDMSKGTPMKFGRINIRDKE